MNDKQVTMEEVQELKTKYKGYIKLHDSLNRLQNNKDFKTVFLEDFCKNEPERITALYGDVNINSGQNKENIRADMLETLISIGKFQEYMRKVIHFGREAKNGLIELENYNFNSESEDDVNSSYLVQ